MFGECVSLAHCGSCVGAALALIWAASVSCILTTRPQCSHQARTRQQVPLTSALLHALSLKPMSVAATLLPLQLMVSLTSAGWSLREVIPSMRLKPTRLRDSRSQELRPMPPATERSQHHSEQGDLPVLIALERGVTATDDRLGKVAPHRRGVFPAAASAQAKSTRGRSRTTATRRSRTTATRRSRTTATRRSWTTTTKRSWTTATRRSWTTDTCELCRSILRRQGVYQKCEGAARSRVLPMEAWRL